MSERAAGVAAGIAVAMGAGCTSIADVPVDAGLAARLAGRSVAVVDRAPPAFGVMLTRLMALGPLGLPGVTEEGEKLRAQFHLVDPAPEIATQLGDLLQGRLGAAVRAPVAITSRDDPASVVAAAPAGADYVLDVTTVRWGIGNLPAPRSNYVVTYAAHVRLIDARAATVVAEGGCVMPMNGTEFTGALGELTRNDGALLKAELSARADRCARRLRADLLGQ